MVATIVGSRSTRMSISLSAAVITAREGTEQRGMGHALRSQVGLALFQFFYDLVACHGPQYTAKRVKKHVLFARQFTRKTSPYPPVAKRSAIACMRIAVKSSAGKNVSSASSDSVISTGVPNTIVVEMKLSTSPLWRSFRGIATWLSGGSGPLRAGIG